MIHFLFIFVISTLFFFDVEPFSKGATTDACESLLPRHTKIKRRENNKSPYRIVASSNFYNETIREIKVELGGAPFKGFLLTAIDPITNQRLGHWFRVQGMDTLPCSAVTHTDSKLKTKATFIWSPPKHRRSGQVIFVGTVVESFDSYYTGLFAVIPMKGFFPRYNNELYIPIYDFKM